jgi:hypothetical protein
MSEIEYDTAIHRMSEARWSKARRGEFIFHMPTGYEIDDLQQMVITNDEAVASAIRTVFIKFDELQSARRVLAWWCDEGLKFQKRRVELKSRPIVWRDPEVRMILCVLHNPIYAGAYVYGRTETVHKVDPTDPRKICSRRAIRKKWPVLIKDHHPGYITFEKFEQNQRQLASNCQMKRHIDDTQKGPAREGWALLQGLVRCGHCGRAMRVAYSASRPCLSTRVLQYRCWV